MKKLKRINWFQVNLSAWIVIIITYIAPFQHQNNDSVTAGFPLSFLTINTRNSNNSFLKSFDLNIASLFLNIIIVYIIVLLIEKLYRNFRKR